MFPADRGHHDADHFHTGLGHFPKTTELPGTQHAGDDHAAPEFQTGGGSGAAGGSGAKGKSHHKAHHGD